MRLNICKSRHLNEEFDACDNPQHLRIVTDDIEPIDITVRNRPTLLLSSTLLLSET